MNINERAIEDFFAAHPLTQEQKEVVLLVCNCNDTETVRVIRAYARTAVRVAQKRKQRQKAVTH